MTKIICKSCKAINPGLSFRCHNCNHDHDLDAREPKVVKNVFVEADFQMEYLNECPKYDLLDSITNSISDSLNKPLTKDQINRIRKILEE